MPKPQKEEPTAELQLAGFLAKYTAEISACAEEILARMRARLPHALELVYDNYNALAIGFGPTERASDVIVSIAVYPKWVSLFFLQAKGLPDPAGVLKGEGNVAKHIVLRNASMLDEPVIQELIAEALSRAKAPLDAGTTHRIIIKSVSAKQRPRRPEEKPAKKAAARKA
jgi:hypothetical protein